MNSRARRSALLLVAAIGAGGLTGCVDIVRAPSDGYEPVDISFEGSDFERRQAYTCVDLAIEAAGWSEKSGIEAEVVIDRFKGVYISEGQLWNAASDTRYQWECELRVALDKPSLAATLTVFEEQPG